METLKYRATGPGRRVAPAGSRAGRGAAQAKAAPCRGMVAGALRDMEEGMSRLEQEVGCGEAGFHSACCPPPAAGCCLPSSLAHKRCPCDNDCS